MDIVGSKANCPAQWRPAVAAPETRNEGSLISLKQSNVTLCISPTTSCVRHVFVQIYVEGFRCLDMSGV